MKSLADDGDGYESSGPKVAAAVAAVAKGEFGQTLAHETERLAQTGEMISGRQSMWLMYREFDLEEDGGHVYDMHDLMA